jgi:dimethylhistidine N-methyltransferase
MIYLDLAPQTDSFTQAVLRGFRSKKKKISPKFFYDARGSELFEKICVQPEYYPTRTETRILYENIGEISAELQSTLIEFGSGSSIKTKILLDHSNIETYIPLDISKNFLLECAEQLRSRYPKISIIPACCDFTSEFNLPEFLLRKPGGRTAFLPGSTLGNFDPIEAARILRSIARLLSDGYLLLGIDLIKDPKILEAAYNDAAGVTAEFNKNLIHRLRDELHAAVDPQDFRHEAFFNAELSRIEMHLTALRDLSFTLEGEQLELKKGESIHTENSYKYSPMSFQALYRNGGFELERFWTDTNEWFGVFLLRVKTPAVAEGLKSLEIESA